MASILQTFSEGISYVFIKKKYTGSWFNIKMSSYQYRKSHCGDKTVVRSSYLHNGISYMGKTISLYWIRVLMLIPECPIDNRSSVVQVIAWHCKGNKSYSCISTSLPFNFTTSNAITSQFQCHCLSIMSLNIQFTFMAYVGWAIPTNDITWFKLSWLAELQ